jgi:hypothetical protein
MSWLCANRPSQLSRYLRPSFSQSDGIIAICHLHANAVLLSQLGGVYSWHWHLPHRRFKHLRCVPHKFAKISVSKRFTDVVQKVIREVVRAFYQCANFLSHTSKLASGQITRASWMRGLFHNMRARYRTNPTSRLFVVCFVISSCSPVISMIWYTLTCVVNVGFPSLGVVNLRHQASSWQCCKNLWISSKRW